MARTQSQTSTERTRGAVSAATPITPLSTEVIPVGGENSHIRFPSQASHLSSLNPSTAAFTGTPEQIERKRQNARRREAGVLVVSEDLRNSRLQTEEAASRPRRHAQSTRRREHVTTDHTGRRSPLASQIDDEGRRLLAELDPDDPSYARRRRGIIANHARLWEEHGATPLVIDFSDIQEPIRPERLHPSQRASRHPERPLYVWALQQAHKVDPKPTREARRHREEWYWDQMDRGKLPPDFNPYAPGSQRHAAFDARTVLNDDRPTSTMFSAVKSAETGERVEVLDTPRQIRARARRKIASGERLTDAEFLALYDKPVEEWDLEELSRGRPKDKNGKFTGRAPSKYAQAEIRERVDTLFKQKVRGSMNETTVKALSLLSSLIENDDIDHKGKPLVAASTKLDAAKFLVEHLLGKPTQRTETDISVKLSGMLASVMVSPEMSLPDPLNPSQPIAGTGRYLAGQRGQRLDHDDVELRQLTAAGYVDPILDAEVVDDDD